MKKNVVRMLALALVLLLVLPLVACGGSGSPSASPSQSASQSPSAPQGSNLPASIKVGFLTDLQGQSAAAGIYMGEGWELAMKKLGGKFGGVPVEMIQEDCASDPATAVTKAIKLVENDKVDILFGCSITSTGNAVAPVAVERQVPFFMPVVAADALTQHNFSKYVIRTGWNSSQPMYLFGKYAYEVLGLRTIAFVGSDFAFTYEQIGSFKIGFETAGGKIVHTQWNPMGTSDFGAYVANIPTDVDALMNCVTGGIGPAMAQEVDNYGLKDKMMILSSGTTVDESWLDACGDAVVGYISASHYSNAIDTPAMKAFVEEFFNEFGRAPAFSAETVYASAMFLDAVYKYIFDNGLDYQNVDDLNKACQSVSVDVPRGTLRLDAYNSAYNHIYIRKTEKVNGKYGTYQNTPIEVYYDVDQMGNGPFTREQRLALPEYSREWPWNASGIY